MTDETVRERQPLPLGRVALYGGIAIVGSIAATLIVRILGLAIVDVSPEFLPLAEPTATISFTAGLVLVAVIVFGILDRTSSNPVRLFNIIALIALILSLVPDILLLVAPQNAPFGGINLGAVLILMLQHVAAYAVTVYVLTVMAYRQ